MSPIGLVAVSRNCPCSAAVLITHQCRRLSRSFGRFVELSNPHPKRSGSNRKQKNLGLGGPMKEGPSSPRIRTAQSRFRGLGGIVCPMFTFLGVLCDPSVLCYQA